MLRFISIIKIGCRRDILIQNAQQLLTGIFLMDDGKDILTCIKRSIVFVIYSLLLKVMVKV